MDLVASGERVKFLHFWGHKPRPDAHRRWLPESVAAGVAREAAGLGAWWAQQHGGASDTERRAKEAELTAYLAEDRDPADIDLDEDDDDDLDDAEIFVEVKTARFLAAQDLPVPDDLPR